MQLKLNKYFFMALLPLWASSATAEKADRYQALSVEAAQSRCDVGQLICVFSGQVVMSRGSLVLRSDRVEVSQDSEGYHKGVATGGRAQSGANLASFRQKREGMNETIEGMAERIEYDARSDNIRLVNRAVIRRYRGNTLVDETTGKLITFDNRAEVFTVSSGNETSNAQKGDNGGRVRAVLSPREGTAAAKEATGASRAPSTSTPSSGPSDAEGRNP